MDVPWKHYTKWKTDKFIETEWINGCLGLGARETEEKGRLLTGTRASLGGRKMFSCGDGYTTMWIY